MKKSELIYTLVTVGVLTIVALVLSFFLSIGESFRLVFGTTLILFVPGFVWSWVFWRRGEIDSIERGALSIALSIALVPLTTYLLFKAGIAISFFNVLIEIIGLIVIGIGLNYFLSKNKSAAGQTNS